MAGVFDLELPDDDGVGGVGNGGIFLTKKTTTRLTMIWRLRTTRAFVGRSILASLRDASP